MAPVAVPVVVPAVKLVQSVHAITSAQAFPPSIITTPRKITVASVLRDISFVPPFELSRARTHVFKHVTAVSISGNDWSDDTHKLYRLRIPSLKQGLSVSRLRVKTPKRVRSSDTKHTKKGKTLGPTNLACERSILNSVDSLRGISVPWRMKTGL